MPLGAAGRGNSHSFPPGFLWGAATAGHQTEGNNTNSDIWAVEHLKPTFYAESSGDACDSFNRWPTDLDIVRSLSLNTYRFSIEWARIEPAPGEFSIAMLDHYRAMIDGCRARGLKPVVTFSHVTCPRWFAIAGGWSNPEAANLFARFCDRAARHLAGGIDRAVTLNEPNLMQLLRWKLPPAVFTDTGRVKAAALAAYGTNHWVSLMVETQAETDAMQPLMMEAHRQGKAAIKAARGDLPVGFSLAIEDDQPAGPNSRRDVKRALCYDPWLKLAQADDFIGVQNYERQRVGDKGDLPPPAEAPKSSRGTEIYPASLAGAVRYAWETAKVPVLVTEHGIGTDDDRQRAALIPAALVALKAAMDSGVPVLGYIHWSLLDNFEWVFGYGPKYGLVAVDRTTFKRTPKPSAGVLAFIAKRNAVS
ncbi:family 1 glycosylhydrolase [Sphingomonas sp. RB3P16]|uniref:glycoside hydrolase family 1 protein n=1 Tax=Parasphingomonas frigoris TaxID=3096163 RepID=UPI002FCA8A91